MVSRLCGSVTIKMHFVGLLNAQALLAGAWANPRSRQWPDPVSLRVDAQFSGTESGLKSGEMNFRDEKNFCQVFT